MIYAAILEKLKLVNDDYEELLETNSYYNYILKADENVQEICIAFSVEFESIDSEKKKFLKQLSVIACGHDENYLTVGWLGKQEMCLMVDE